MARQALSSRYRDQAEVLPKVPPTTPRSPAAVLLHIVALVSLTNSFRLLLWQDSPLNEWMDTQYGGHWQFLTILSLAVSWLTFVAALAKDALPGLRQLDTVKTALSVIAVPVEGLVSLLYWGMHVVDPTLLVPADSKFRISTALDVSLHALPAAFLWADFLAFSPRMSPNVRPKTIASVATLCYVCWMEFAAHKNAVGGQPFYPYPFLNDLSQPQRSAFYVAQIPVLIVLFYAANGVHKLVRGDTDRETQSASAKKLK